MKVEYLALAFTVVFATLFFIRPVDSIAAGDGVIKSAGCKTEYFLMQDLSAAYKKKTGIKIQLGKTGNKKAINLLMDNKIDFTFTCKTIDQLAKKLKLDKEVISTWKSIPIAKDPIVIVSNSKNGVKGLTTQQLSDIFQGNINNWKEVGGNDLPVLLSYMNPELESAVVLLFKEFTMSAEGQLDKNAHISNGPSMSGNYVSKTPGGVTFIGFNSYKKRYGDILEVDGTAPSRDNILTGKYSLSTTYYLTVDGNERADLSRFIEYILSDDGQKAIEVNFIPYSE